jgi:hypothetical protein
MALTKPSTNLIENFTSDTTSIASSVSTSQIDSIDSTDIEIPNEIVGSPVGDMLTVDDMWRHFMSGTVISGCDIINHNNGTFSIDAGVVVLREGTDDDSPLKVFEVDAVGPFTPADNDVTYYYIEYVAGSPPTVQWNSGSDIYSYNGTTKMQAYTISRDGTHLHIISSRGQSIDGNRKTRRRDLEWDGNVQSGFWHARGGSVLGSSGLALTVTTGRFYYGLAPVDHIAFDTTVGSSPFEGSEVFEYWYNRSSYIEVPNSRTINNTQYDNNGTLTTMNNARYRTDWVYIILCGAEPHLAVIMGNAQYNTLAEAQNASLPSTIPGLMDGASVVIGQAVVQKNATTLTIRSAFGNQFSTTAITDHGATSGLTDNDHPQYLYMSGLSQTAGSGTLKHFIASATTTNATPTELTVNGTTLAVPNNSTWMFTIRLVGRRTTAGAEESLAAELRGLISHESSTTSLIGSVIDTPIAESVGSPIWSYSVTADNTNDTLDITVVGAAGVTVNWFAFIQVIEVTD